MTKTMNQTQRNYVEKRLQGIANTAITRIKQKHTTKAVNLSWDEKVKMIQTGKVKFKTDADFRSYQHPASLFDFSAHEKPAMLTPAGKKLIEQVETQLQNSIDKVMLAGAEEALNVLKVFTEATAKL